LPYEFSKKDGKNYCGDDGLEVEYITNWHIGGTVQKSQELIYEALGKKE
jgi:hypothetical protein